MLPPGGISRCCAPLKVYGFKKQVIYNAYASYAPFRGERCRIEGNVRLPNSSDAAGHPPTGGWVQALPKNWGGAGPNECGAQSVATRPEDRAAITRSGDRPNPRDKKAWNPLLLLPFYIFVRKLSCFSGSYTQQG